MVFPNNLLHFEVGREKSIAAVEWAVSNNYDVFLVAQKEMKVEDPKPPTSILTASWPRSSR